MRAEDGDLQHARDRLARARMASGAAAYAYFFHADTPEARAAYVAALRAEDAAEALLASIEAARAVDAPGAGSGGP